MKYLVLEDFPLLFSEDTGVILLSYLDVLIGDLNRWAT